MKLLDKEHPKQETRHGCVELYFQFDCLPHIWYLELKSKIEYFPRKTPILGMFQAPKFNRSFNWKFCCLLKFCWKGMKNISKFNNWTWVSHKTFNKKSIFFKFLIKIIAWSIYKISQKSSIFPLKNQHKNNWPAVQSHLLPILEHSHPNVWPSVQLALPR